MRRLAADLRISTRTLYKRIGSRGKLIRTVVGRHFSTLRLNMRTYDSWDSTALNWCMALHEALRAHPHVTELISDDDSNHLLEYVGELIEVTVQEGIPRTVATKCCRSLVNLTISDAIMEIRASRGPNPSSKTAPTTPSIARDFPEAARLILAGTRALSSAQPTSSRH